MAMINIEVDTSKKAVSVSVDGKKVSNVAEIYIASQGDYFGVSVTSLEDGEDLRKVTRLVASEDGNLKEEICESAFSKLQSDLQKALFPHRGV